MRVKIDATHIETLDNKDKKKSPLSSNIKNIHSGLSQEGQLKNLSLVGKDIDEKFDSLPEDSNTNSETPNSLLEDSNTNTNTNTNSETPSTEIIDAEVNDLIFDYNNNDLEELKDLTSQIVLEEYKNDEDIEKMFDVIMNDEQNSIEELCSQSDDLENILANLHLVNLDCLDNVFNGEKNIAKKREILKKIFSLIKSSHTKGDYSVDKAYFYLVSKNPDLFDIEQFQEAFQEFFNCSLKDQSKHDPTIIVSMKEILNTKQNVLSLYEVSSLEALLSFNASDVIDSLKVTLGSIVNQKNPELQRIFTKINSLNTASGNDKKEIVKSLIQFDSFDVIQNFFRTKSDNPIKKFIENDIQIKNIVDAMNDINANYVNNKMESLEFNTVKYNRLLTLLIDNVPKDRQSKYARFAVNILKNLHLPSKNENADNGFVKLTTIQDTQSLRAFLKYGQFLTNIVSNFMNRDIQKINKKDLVKLHDYFQNINNMVKGLVSKERQTLRKERVKLIQSDIQKIVSMTRNESLRRSKNPFKKLLYNFRNKVNK